MGLADEVRLYESLWDEPKKAVRKTGKKHALTQAKKPAKRLTESRSAAEIQAEIDALMVELRAAQAAEKRAANGVPTVLWSWDIYFDPSEKGTWTSLEDEVVFETREDALNSAITHLNELDEEGELDYYPDEYTIDVFEVPLSQVSADVLSFSNLDHLITQGATKMYSDDVCSVYFKHDPSTAVFTGSKQDCDRFVKNNISNAATQARGGLVVKKGGSVPVAKKLEQVAGSLKQSADDPYGYGPYKDPTDPTLRVGDYIKAKQYARDDEWYPARVTSITPDFVDYTISGFGFVKNGTVVRSAKAKSAFSNLRKRLSETTGNLKQASSSSGTPQFEITYCFGNGPANVGYLYAEDENEARESFIDYLVDNGEIVYDDDVTILKIKRT